MTRAGGRAVPFSALLAFSGGIAAVPAGAQDIPVAAPVLNIPEDEFIPSALDIGGATVTIGGVARAEYDSNIYAQDFGAKDDVKLILQPYVDISKTASTIELSSHLEGNFRRYLTYTTENADGGSVQNRIAWAPTASDRVLLLSGYLHGIEDRGEPEASTITRIGPRQFDAFNADLSYTHQGPRLGFSVRGTADTFRYTRDIDENRDLDSYALIGRVTYRVGALANSFVEGFVNTRDFAPTVGEAGLNRDSNTYGGRAGVAIDPGGVLRGEAAFGVYRFDPKDDLLAARTGFSAQVGLVYQPFVRTAFTLDAFTGNVATYQAGASSREDTRIRLGVQQELRHDIRWQASVLYRRSRYFGTGLTQNIFGGLFEIEYVVNRRLIVAANLRYADRDSTVPLDGYSRLRTGLALKVHY